MINDCRKNRHQVEIWDAQMVEEEMKQQQNLLLLVENNKEMERG